MTELIMDEVGVGTNQYQVKPKTKRKVKSNKFKVLSIIATVAILASGAGYYINTHTFDWQSPILVKLQTPLVIAKRVSEVITVTKTEVIKEEGVKNVSPLTPDQQYACNLFGKDCATAIAIMRAESHYKHDVLNINSNGTVDMGCWQINSIHLKNIDTTNINLLNCQENTNVAYKIYTQQKGFGAWVAYTSGAYKNYLYQ